MFTAFLKCIVNAWALPPGLWLHESGVLGASPDGLVVAPPVAVPAGRMHYQTAEARGAVPHLLEVKCPYSARELTVHQAVSQLKDFCLSASAGG